MGIPLLLLSRSLFLPFSIFLHLRFLFALPFLLSLYQQRMWGKTKMDILSAMVAVLSFSLIFQGKFEVEGKVHHVVGDDRGWDTSTDVAAWAARKIFRVGDSLWFTYSAALENVVEVRTREEYESCDVTNPIRMYTDGLSDVSLDSDRTRYFTSGNFNSCKNGLRLRVHVKPLSAAPDEVMKPLAQSEQAALAATPVSPPSDSTRPAAAMSSLLAGVILFCVASSL